MQFSKMSRQLRRRVTKGQRQVEGIGAQAERDIDRYFFHRYSHLLKVRRFLIAWVLLLVLLIIGVIGQNFLLDGYFQTLQAVPGGRYDEGILGTFTTANPLYATSDVDTSVSHLLFASLFSYNNQNKLVGDLASSYSVDAAGTTYTVHLKPHLTWQDGQALTSKDVLFTYRTIQDPDAQSPLQASWQGITVNAPDPLTITFKLPNVLASFPYTLTNGIVPEHILNGIPLVTLRSANFNTVDPVGSGPFAWRAIQVSGTNPEDAIEQIALTPFAGYVGGKPKLDEFVVHAYADQGQLENAFEKGQLQGVEGLTTVPAAIAKIHSAQIHNLILTAGTYAFFKTTSGVLADQKVRQALIQGADVPSIMQHLGYPTQPVREPLLEGQLGYNPKYAETSYDIKAAEASLTSDGWIIGKDGIRYKSGQPLMFNLSATSDPEYESVAKQLSQMWRELGANVITQFQPPADFTTTLSEHDYQAVLYGISIGVDPDVFVYWDSSQADIRSPNRLNFSEFKDATADESLEEGRTRLDPALRVIKYQPFLQEWQQQAPALGLYQPRDLYITNGLTAGLTDHTINTSTDRYDTVQDWEVREARVTN